MFQELVSHNKDIEDPLLRGYAVALDSDQLLVLHIPYLDKFTLCGGAIVCKFEMTGGGGGMWLMPGSASVSYATT